MTIGEILAKRELGDTISSVSAEMHEQSPESFTFWLLADTESSEDFKLRTLTKILQANDWQID